MLLVLNQHLEESGVTIMNKWGIFASGFCAAVNAYALFISVFGDFTLVLITKAEWVLS